MTVPPRDRFATRAEEASRLRAIVTGAPTVTVSIRVKRTEDGALGWRRGWVILADDLPGLQLLAHWTRSSKEDQEDFGVPPEAWGTAFGYWLEVGS